MMEVVTDDGGGVRRVEVETDDGGGDRLESDDRRGPSGRYHRHRRMTGCPLSAKADKR